jgi:hypothetical protein
MHIIQPVFVALPLGNPDHIRSIFDEGIKPALASFGFEARRVDDQAPRGSLTETIIKEIKSSYFLIADLTDERPNCYYEVGYAQALGKPVLLIKKGDAKVHFNVSQHMIHSYANKAGIQKLLKNQVPKFLETIRRQSDDSRNGQFGRLCIRDDFRLTAKIDKCTSERCWLTFEVCSLNEKAPLTGKVKFYMHKKYLKTAQSKSAQDGVATYEEVEAHYGPWTLAAEVLNTGTKLELDLATIPGAKDWWYREAYSEV